jgi:hypothetical protein
MTTKHSYMDESEKKPDPAPVEKGTSDKDQKNIKRTDPALQKGYNEKNPSQPQGGFTADSQAEESLDSQTDKPSEGKSGNESA